MKDLIQLLEYMGDWDNKILKQIATETGISPKLTRKLLSLFDMEPDPSDPTMLLRHQPVNHVLNLPVRTEKVPIEGFKFAIPVVNWRLEHALAEVMGNIGRGQRRQFKETVIGDPPPGWKVSTSLIWWYKGPVEELPNGDLPPEHVLPDSSRSRVQVNSWKDIEAIIDHFDLGD